MFWFALGATLVVLCFALISRVDPDVAALCLAGMLFVRHVFDVSAGIAKALDRLANCFLLSFRLSVPLKLLRFHLLKEFLLPSQKPVHSFILPPPAAPSLLTV